MKTKNTVKKLVSVILTISVVIISFASVLQIYAKNEKSNSIQVGQAVIESEEDAQTPERPINISPDEYVIYNKLSFIVFMKTSLLWKPSTKVILACDINMQGEKIKSLKEYSGKFDGRGHTISNFTITKRRLFLPVLIGTLNKSAEIKNVTFKNNSKKAMGLAVRNFGSVSSVNIKNSSVGEAGFIYGNAGVIENCSFEGKVSYAGYLGGFCGVNEGKISKCSFLGKVKLSSSLLTFREAHYVIDNILKLGIVSINYKSESEIFCTIGGFCGYNKGEISSCETKGKSSVISNDAKVYITKCGGFVGINERKSKINNCTSVGSVAGQEFVGGFCADNRGDITDSKSECEAVAKSVMHDEICGGFVGNNCKKGKIENCTSTGSATGGEYVGSFVGVNKSDIIKCDATGKATAKTQTHIARAGGFVGENKKGKISNCTAEGGVESKSVSGKAKAGGFVGVNKAEITNSKAYTKGKYEDGKDKKVYVSDGIGRSNNSCGGFVGKNDKDGNIDNCYAECTVETSKKNKGAGFVGEAENLSKIYNSTCKTKRVIKEKKKEYTEDAKFCYKADKKAVIESCDDNIKKK